MKKIITLFFALVLCLGTLTGCNEDNTTPQGNNSENQTTSSKDNSDKASSADDNTDNTDQEDNNKDTDSNDELLSGTHHIEIEIKDYGTMSVELDADTAPITVTNFIKLAEDGFYDGLTFHRIISGFMIQGGDPLGTGMGGADETIKGEFSANSIENDIEHVRGTISMARATDYDSASSQFFIMHQDTPALDGQYAAFGHVTEGIEIVDQICEDTPVEDDNGTVASENQPVITSIKVID